MKQSTWQTPKEKLKVVGGREVPQKNVFEEEEDDDFFGI